MTEPKRRPSRTKMVMEGTMDKKFRNAGAGCVYFEDVLLSIDQIVMLLNDGFEKTMKLDQIDEDRLTEGELSNFEYLINKEIIAIRKTIEKDPVTGNFLTTEHWDTLLEKVRKSK